MVDKLMKRLAELNTKDCLWIYILKILSDEPMHAYRIRSEIRKRFGFSPGNVTAYRVLYYLTSEGFVEKKNSGRRKVYSITEKGKIQLNKARKFYERQLNFLEE